MSEINDGGSAFPEIFTDTKGERGDYRQETYSAGGMTLRDYFAAKAMQGIVATLRSEAGASTNDSESAIARLAYRVADAMLKTRGE